MSSETMLVKVGRHGGKAEDYFAMGNDSAESLLSRNNVSTSGFDIRVNNGVKSPQARLEEGDIVTLVKEVTGGYLH